MKRLLRYFLITLKSKLTKQEQFSSYTKDKYFIRERKGREKTNTPEEMRF
jgi:hypothetical protein